jgi:hypothetical protein
VNRDPVRLFDDDQLPSQLRDDLRAAGADAGADYDKDAGYARFSALLAGGATTALGGSAAKGGAAAATGASSTAGSLGALKAIGIVVLGLGFAGGIGVALQGGSSKNSAVAPVQPAPTAIAEAPKADAPAAVPAPEATTDLAQAPVPSPAANAPAQASRAVAAKPAAPAVAASDPTPSAQPEAQPEEGRSVKDETAHLASMRSAAHSDPARALAMAAEGNARFPKGIFGQEREVIAIQSLAALGRRDEARTRAEAFLARHPKSPFGETLRRVTGIDP